jgi:hypothetical protein
MPPVLSGSYVVSLIGEVEVLNNENSITHVGPEEDGVVWWNHMVVALWARQI